MTDTFTASLRFQQPTVNADKGIWGGILNTDLQIIEDAITGVETIDLTGLTVFTLSSNNGAVDQARKRLLIFTGALTADCAVTIPQAIKIGLARNATTGGHNVVLTTGAGSPLTLSPNAVTTQYYCAGTNVTSLGVNAAGVQANGFDSGGAQFRAVSGGYGAMIRNDGTSTFLLLTATGDPYGNFNTYRPFAVNNFTGAVLIDGTGLGTTIGGNVAITGTLSSSSFANSLSGTSGFQKYAGGFIEQWGQATTDVNGDLTVNYPITFPNGPRNVTLTVNLDSSVIAITTLLRLMNATGFVAASMGGNAKIANIPLLWRAIGS